MADTNTDKSSTSPIVHYTPAKTGRLGVLSVMGAASNSIPLPFVPGRTLTSIRGAVAHDVIQRHGLSCTTEARQIITNADSPNPKKAQVIGMTNYVTSRFIKRFGPLWFLAPTVSGVEVFALGHLLDRYLESYRESHSVRIQPSEAHFIRRVIDRSVFKALSPTLRVPSGSGIPQPSTDDRDDTTKMVDWLLVSAASLPSYLVRRLEAAFDEVIERERAARREQRG